MRFTCAESFSAALTSGADEHNSGGGILIFYLSLHSPTIHLSIHLFMDGSVHPSIHLWINLLSIIYIHPPIILYLSISTNHLLYINILSIHSSTNYLSIPYHLSIHPFIYPSMYHLLIIYPSFHPSIYYLSIIFHLSIHPFTIYLSISIIGKTRDTNLPS